MASTHSTGFDWPTFWRMMDGCPSKIDYLAAEARVDAEWLWCWLAAEVERRRCRVV